VAVARETRYGVCLGRGDAECTGASTKWVIFMLDVVAHLQGNIDNASRKVSNIWKYYYYVQIRANQKIYIRIDLARNC
jgi:hypothetical protein